MKPWRWNIKRAYHQGIISLCSTTHQLMHSARKSQYNFLRSQREKKKRVIVWNMMEKCKRQYMNSATYLRNITCSILQVAFILISAEVVTIHKDKIWKIFQSIISWYKNQVTLDNTDDSCSAFVLGGDIVTWDRGWWK